MFEYANNMRYRNPILPGFYPDPSICRVGEDFYLVTSSFEYFPGVPIFHSRDLVNWRQIGHCLTRRSQLPLEDCRPSKGIWAPTLRCNKGIFYMATTNTAPGGIGNFMVTATDPAGPWSDPVPLAIDGIDPSLFFDDDGRVYLTTSENRQAEIDPATGALLGPVRKVWENGTDGGYMEAPHLFKHAGWYYLIVAEGGTGRGHMSTIARSRDPWGSFEPCPYNPILTHRHRGATPLQSTGHADFVTDSQGNTWAVFLGIRTTPGMFPRYHTLGREAFLAPVTWTVDDWPLVNGGREIAFEMECGLPAHPWPQPPSRDEFDAAELRFDWVHLRNPECANYSLTARPGWLRLLGSPVSLDEIASPTAIFRRQTAHCFEAAALLEFEPRGEKEEAGMTLLANNAHHYDLFITRRNERRVVELRLRVCEIAAIQASIEIANGPVTLKITGEPASYRFAFETGGETIPLGHAASKLLSTEVASGFTGVMIGLYAAGAGQPGTPPADFDWFEMA